MSKTPDLKHCPFCGSEESDLFIATSRSMRSQPIAHFVYCLKCKTEGPVAKTPAWARRKWNTRKGESKPSYLELLKKKKPGKPIVDVGGLPLQPHRIERGKGESK